jgi:pimeloyl-ACP methyl ester carboxylesterase
VPLANAEFLQQRLPHSKLDIIDAGHFTWEDASSNRESDQPTSSSSYPGQA